jgi:hypothetical protein
MCGKASESLDPEAFAKGNNEIKANHLPCEWYYHLPTGFWSKERTDLLKNTLK